MVNKIILFSFFLISIAHAKVKISVEYSESANYFDIMDNVSNWWDGFTDIEYSKEWEKRIGIKSPEDVKLFEKYTELREKYYKDPDQKEKDPLKNRNGFFSMSSSATADPIAEAFYSSLTMDEAYKKLENKLKPEEINFLKSFYLHFKSQAEVFLKESEAFRTILPKMRKSLTGNKVTSYFSKVANFYNVEPSLEYRILYVWFPPIERSNASPTGKYLVMRYNPIKALKIAEEDSDIAFHEVVHVISNQQTFDQKKMLTEEFLKTCDIKDSLKKLTILEEPLAVIFGQILFLEQFNPTRLKWDQSLYNNPWISTYAKLLFPIAKDRLNKSKKITDDFVPAAARICKELVQASMKLNANKAPAPSK